MVAYQMSLANLAISLTSSSQVLSSRFNSQTIESFFFGNQRECLEQTLKEYNFAKFRWLKRFFES